MENLRTAVEALGAVEFDNISVIVWVILACEVGFWVFVVGGLALRYLLRARKAATIVLLFVPIIDVILLIAVALDLRSGTEVSFVHRVAAIYLGVSVVFGPSLIRWADKKAQAFWTKGTHNSEVSVADSRSALSKEWQGFLRWLLAAAIILVSIVLLSVTVANEQQRSDLLESVPLLGLITVIWFLTGPMWESGKRLSDRR